MIKCEICGREFKRHCDLSLHLSHTHNLTAKEYYNRYFKQKDEGICCVCGKPTRFLNVTEGYRKTCSRKCTIFNKYGVENSYLIKEVVQRAYSKKKSKTEQNFEDNLKKFNIDFIPQYKSDKYPYFCDFFLPEYDCYIELNIFWSHQQCWFDLTLDVCKKKLNHLQDKINSTSGKLREHYEKSFKTWTEVDLKKREVARKNNLNYKVFWTQEEIEEFFENFSIEKLKNNRDYK